MRSALLLATAALLPAVAPAQSRPLTTADSLLVAQVLRVEDARRADEALTRALRHPDPRLRQLAWRAGQRIRDPKFVARDSMVPLPASPAWPEPAWRLRYRALGQQRANCAALTTGLRDSVWHVRLRAAGLLPAACASDTATLAILRAWVDDLPADLSRRAAGQVSWHAAAHAIVALARVWPDEARARLSRLQANREWRLRLYAARAAAQLGDTARLRTFAGDSSDNVREAAVEGLSRLVGHDADEVYLQVLRAPGAQAVRAAAVALKGSPRADVPRVVATIHRTWSRRSNASERDVRVALLEAMGRSAAEDSIPRTVSILPTEAVALALGQDVRLRVTMSEASGGGSFIVRLRGDVAPVMAARILGLVRRGYYDGLTWHRVEPDFVIQGGSPDDNEYVGWSSFLRDELGTIAHPRGTVGMSTRGHDTGDAQWFLNLKDNARLVTDYTVFGEVVEGIEVVDGVMEGDRIERIEVIG